MAKAGPRNLITDVAGIKVGNAQDMDVRTGVTVVLCDEPTVAVVDSRGGAPGTRETDALKPECLVGGVDALFLSGGSVYGLDAGSGIMAWLAAQGRGYQIATSPVKAPITPGAILFDLMNEGDKGWGMNPPYRDLGIAACEAAGLDFALGTQGAGTGAVAGQLKGGLGSASVISSAGYTVGALIAANPIGSTLVAGTDKFWAAPFELNREFGGKGVATTTAMAGMPPDTKRGPDGAEDAPHDMRGNTTIGIVATDAALTQVQAQRLAIMAQDGLARAIRPAHTPFDGDTLFVLATAKKAVDEPMGTLLDIGALAADCVARATARAVYEATSLGASASYQDMFG
ncbi:MAG: P1 family peptidase [Alphaproteobacteria bacterium]